MLKSNLTREACLLFLCLGVTQVLGRFFDVPRLS
jgi:hypothetical protein